MGKPAYKSPSLAFLCSSVPPADRVEEFAEVAADSGIPLKQFTRLCVIGGNDDEPDGLVAD